MLSLRGRPQPPLFQRARSAVTILSAPEGWIVQRRGVESVEKPIEELLPNASPRRLAVLRGTTENVTLSLLICQSGILAGETLAHFVGYMQNAFCRPGVDVALQAARMRARWSGPSEINLTEIDEILLRGTGASL
jgi:hypothetical protein